MRVIKTVLFLIISISSSAQTGVMKGHVSYIEDNNSFSGLTIVLIKDGKELFGAITDKNGDYEIKDIPVGKYDLKISMLGFKSKIIKDIEIKENQNLESLTFPDPCVPSERICPHVHKDYIIPILYGYPTKSQLRKAKKRKIKLGGCVVTNCDPKWFCTKHNIEF